jgi:hypothetical protein
MIRATTTSRRRRIRLGVVLAAALALGTAFVANASSHAVTPAQRTATTLSAPAGCPAIGTLVAGAVTATSPGATTTAVTTTRSRAADLARTTASDDVRELAQNLADDLAAYRVTLTTRSNTTAQRHIDIGAAIGADLTALRHLCGH